MRMSDSLKKETDESKAEHPLSRYLKEKVYTWDRHFGPLERQDYDSVALEIEHFLSELKKGCDE